MKLGSLFSGSGGFELAGAMNGIEPVWASEIEPYPISVTSARFPHMKHLGDITKIDGSQIEPVDIVCFGSPCFPSGTLVNTLDGYKPIESVTIFDKVLTHTGEYKRVTHSTYTGNKQLWELKTMLSDTIKATGNHPFYVRTMYRQYQNGQAVRLFTEPTFKKLSEMNKQDYVGMPIDNRSENDLNITKEEAWLIGRYIADGYVRDEQRPHRPVGSCFHSVVFCVGSGKEDSFEKHLSHLDKYGKSTKTNNVTKYTINSQRLCVLCSSCGQGAENKNFPSWTIGLPVDLLKEMLDGYISGDGSSVGNDRFKITTVSKCLAYSVASVIAKVYHRPCSVYFNKRPPTHIIEGRVVNQKDFYQIVWKKSAAKQDKAFYENGYIWSPIRSITKTQEISPVYDLTVDEDHSFCVYNIAVHNCQDISTAGKMVGLQDGKRSSLFFEAIRIIKEMRDATNGEYPKYVCFENVPGIFSSNKGEDFRTALENFCSIKGGEVSIPLPEKGKWQPAGAIMGDGYTVAWRTVNAAYWGTPQRRRRCYALINLTDGSAESCSLLFEQESMPGNSPTVEGAWENASQYVARSS